MSSREHDHLKDLSQIRHLVIDEADRMVQQGSFPQLTRIFDAIQRANPMDDDDESTGEDDEDADDDQDRMLGLPGIPGEARLTMLNDEILQRLNQQRTEEDEPPQVKEIDDEEFEEQQREIEFGNDLDEDEVSLPVAPPVQRRTYIYSATLTLPASANYKTAKKRLKMNIDVDGAIAEILEKSRAKGVTKVIDLTNGMKKAKQTKSDGDAKIADDKFCLPPGLTLKQIKCTQKHKDSHLYAYLMTSEEAASGPSLVFCNSIAAVRRIGSMLKTLGLDVQMLHAHMQQVSIWSFHRPYCYDEQANPLCSKSK